MMNLPPSPSQSHPLTAVSAWGPRAGMPAPVVEGWGLLLTHFSGRALEGPTSCLGDFPKVCSQVLLLLVLFGPGEATRSHRLQHVLELSRGAQGRRQPGP